MERRASVVWQGEFKDGLGKITTSSGALSNVEYGFSSRFETARGTNPEELIAAAHAACFSMFLANLLGQAGFPPEKIDTTGSASLNKVAENWTITDLHLNVRARVPRMEDLLFERVVEEARDGCPVSRLLKAPITVDAVLESFGEVDTNSQEQQVYPV